MTAVNPEPPAVEEETTPTEPSTQEQLGATYMGQMNYFRKMVTRKGMSAKKIARVLIAAAEFPLANGGPRLLDNDERMMFQLFHAVQTSKNQFLEVLLKSKQIDGETTSEDLNQIADTISAEKEVTNG